MNVENNLTEKHVGEIVSENYEAAGVFRKFGMDFCCNGGISLKDACLKKKVKLEDVLDELTQLNSNKTKGDENYMAWEPPFLIDHIVNTHHSFVKKKSEEIAFYAAKVAKVHGDRHPENITIFQKFTELVNELRDHLNEEEESVFPLIKTIVEKRKSGKEVSQSEIDTLKKELELMEKDHSGAGELIAEIRELSNNFTPPQDACATYRILYQNLEGFEEDLHKHVHLENNILFKKAETLI